MKKVKVKEEFELVNCNSFSKEQVELCISSATLRYKNLLIPTEMLTNIVKKKIILFAYGISTTRVEKEHIDCIKAQAAILYQVFQELAKVCNFDPIEELLRGRPCDSLSMWRIFLDPKLLQDCLDFVPDHKDEVSCLSSNSKPSEWVPVLGIEVPKSLLRDAAEMQSNDWIEQCNNIASDAEAGGYPQPDFLHKLRRMSILSDMLVTLLDGGDVDKNSPSGYDEAWTEEDWHEAYTLFIIKEENS